MAGVRRPGEPPAAVVLAVSAVLVVAVAGIDYATGTELRVFPLYFLPVLGIALRFGRLSSRCAPTSRRPRAGTARG